jgi:hypothetical protein
MVGMTMTSITASEFRRMVRLPAPIGPCGSRTPPEQPAKKDNATSTAPAPFNLLTLG